MPVYSLAGPPDCRRSVRVMAMAERGSGWGLPCQLTCPTRSAAMVGVGVGVSAALLGGQVGVGRGVEVGVFVGLLVGVMVGVGVKVGLGVPASDQALMYEPESQ